MQEPVFQLVHINCTRSQPVDQSADLCINLGKEPQQQISILGSTHRDSYSGDLAALPIAIPPSLAPTRIARAFDNAWAMYTAALERREVGDIWNVSRAGLVRQDYP